MKGYKSLVLLCSSALLLCALPQTNFAQSIVSATAQSPIQLGQSMTVTCTLLNDGWYDWDPIDLDYSCGFEVWSSSDYYLGETDSTTYVPSGGRITLTYILDPRLLPTNAGNYSLKVYGFYNLLDLDYYYTPDSPVNVNFTVNAGNHAPTISAITDKIVVDTNLLSFTVSALDTDTPAQALTWALGSGAPTGASINSTNGLFSWAPPGGYAPSTNQITVIVTDNGSPAMSATNTFKVVVLNPLRLRINKMSGAIRFTWDSYPGAAYQLGYCTNITSPSWTYQNIYASEAVTSFTNYPPLLPQRYYRLKLMP